MERIAFTVIVPAHNEAQVIARCLDALLADAPVSHAMQIIVAANGCDDRTAEIARSAAPDAVVIELAEGSKPKALNAARAIARHDICLFVDADVACSYSSAAALAQALTQPGVMAASPAIKLDLSRSSALVRSYYRVWLALPYVTDRMVGSGCFGLSKAALAQIGDFPEIIGDDIWIRSQFDRNQRRSVESDDHGEPVFFLVSPPRSLLDQIRVESRRRIGNGQVDALLGPSADQSNQSANHRGHHSRSDLLAARTRGASWMDLGVYTVAKFAVIARTRWAQWRGQAHRWERDLAAREA